MNNQLPPITLEYYQRPFHLISQQIDSEIFKHPHQKRKSFWSLVPEKEYKYSKAKELIEAYYRSLLNEINFIVSSKSRMYWLHLSRRILPYSSGKDKSPATIGITRRIIDGAIEKYAKDTFCNHIGLTGNIDISEVFDGLLLSKDFEYERNSLQNSPNQVVFTKFNQANMVEYYALEKLAYEIWKCGATLRSLSKGATILVDHSNEEYFIELRTPEIEFLIDNYDNRNSSFVTSRKGVVLENKEDLISGKLMVPTLNISHVKMAFFNRFLEEIGVPISFVGESPANFLPILFPFRGFCINNRPLFNSFYKKYKIEVVSILTVVTALLFRIQQKTFIEKDTTMIKPLFTRAYQGPIPEKDILNELEYYKDAAFIELDLTEEEKLKVNIKGGYKFLRLNDTRVIDLLYPAPLKLFIPVSKERVIIDYSKIVQILNDLMFQVSINDENFKGTLFENFANISESVLPTKQCNAIDNSSKQIDFAFGVNNILVICECKLKENSLGYFKGNLQSLETRKTNVIDKSINESNEKATWLSQRPIGRNYSITNYDYILPVGLSAFKEYTPSLDKKYWITESIPRVLTVEEIKEIISNNVISESNFNLIKINKSTTQSST